MNRRREMLMQCGNRSWNLASANLVGTKSVSSQDGNPLGVWFSVDGLKMFVLGDDGNDVSSYTLSTAWDISTATYTSAFSVAVETTSPLAIAFSANGLYLFVSETNSINQYTLSTAWDISTASYTRNASVSGQDSNPDAMWFSVDGLKMFMQGNSSPEINRYSLSSAWNISTLSYVANKNVGYGRGLFLSDDGLMLFFSSNTTNNLKQYSLSPAWDITSAALVRTLDVSANYGPRGLYIAPSGRNLYFADQQFPGAKIVRYRMI